jgi:hypothetical protein
MIVINYQFVFDYGGKTSAVFLFTDDSTAKRNASFSLRIMVVCVLRFRFSRETSSDATLSCTMYHYTCISGSLLVMRRLAVPRPVPVTTIFLSQTKFCACISAIVNIPFNPFRFLTSRSTWQNQCKPQSPFYQVTM